MRFDENLKSAAINVCFLHCILQLLGGWYQFCKVVSRIVIKSNVSLMEYALLV